MSKVRCKDTKPEWILRSALHHLGFRYQLHRKNLPGNPDLIFPKYRSVIMVHGCFWHRHLNCKAASMPMSNREFWRNKFAATIKRDSRVLRELHALGWRTMIVWECQLERDTLPAVNRVAKWLLSSRSTQAPLPVMADAISRSALIRRAADRVKSRTIRYSTHEPLVELPWPPLDQAP